MFMHPSALKRYICSICLSGHCTCTCTCRSGESCHFTCRRAFIQGTCVGINIIHLVTPFSIDILVNSTPATLEYHFFFYIPNAKYAFTLALHLTSTSDIFTLTQFYTITIFIKLEIEYIMVI